MIRRRIYIVASTKSVRRVRLLAKALTSLCPAVRSLRFRLR